MKFVLLVNWILGVLTFQPIVLRHAVLKAQVSSRVFLACAQRVVVTGIHNSVEDVDLLTVLSKMSDISKVIAISDHCNELRKTLMSREAKYSGMLEKVSFEEDISSGLKDAVRSRNVDAWIAKGITARDFSTLSNELSDCLPRVVFAMDAREINGNVDLFEETTKELSKRCQNFTIISYGELSPGGESAPYEIRNLTVGGTSQGSIEGGTLNRVLAESLFVSEAIRGSFSIRSAGAFAEAYLQTLRSCGLTRREEVAKLFSGGMQRMEEITNISRNAKSIERTNPVVLEETHDSACRTFQSHTDEDLDLSFEFRPLNRAEFVSERTTEWLNAAWDHFVVRGGVSSISRQEFDAANEATAREAAGQELMERIQKIQAKEQKEMQKTIFNRYVDGRRNANMKFALLEEAELQAARRETEAFLKFLLLVSDGEPDLGSTSNFNVTATSDTTQMPSGLSQNDLVVLDIARRRAALQKKYELDATPPWCSFDPDDAAAIVSRARDRDSETWRRLSLDRPLSELLVEAERKLGNKLQTTDYHSWLLSAREVVDKVSSPRLATLPSKSEYVSAVKAYRSYIKSRLRNYALTFRRLGGPSEDH